MKNLLLKLAAGIAGRLPPRLRSRIYELGPLTRWIRRSLNEAAPAGLTKVNIAAGQLKGTTFRLNLQSEKDLWLGTYETSLLDRLSDWIEPGMVVFDVGANLGYVTIAFAQLVGPEGEVHAFEPLPANLDRLRQSIKGNNMDDRVRVVPKAVGAGEGTADFLIHPSGGMGKLEGSFGRKEGYSGSIQAEVTTLDGYLQTQGVVPDWVKVDVEGGEGAVLEGSTQLLNEIRPGWLMEIHGPEAAAEVWQMMAAADYSLFSVKQLDRSLQSAAELGWKAYLVALAAERRQ